MYRVTIKNIFFDLWFFIDKKFETLDDAKTEIEKRVNDGQCLSGLKIVKECEDVKIKAI